MNDSEPLLSVRDLGVAFGSGDRAVQVVQGVSFALGRGETVALVGESGCGKSLTARALIGLLPPGGVITGGSVRCGGTELVGADADILRSVRGRRIGFVFQEPRAALNGVLTIGVQLREVLLAHGVVERGEAHARAVELLASVGLPDPARVADEHAHRLSGGMCQRAMIALALAADPEVLIADEPTTALDVTVAAQIFALVRQERDARGLGVLWITHDLTVVEARSDRVLVMYAGELVEAAPTAALFAAPKHPYTKALLGARLGQSAAPVSIPGRVPEPSAMPSGCRFHPRCPRAEPRCAAESPSWRDVESSAVRCHFAE